MPSSPFQVGDSTTRGGSTLTLGWTTAESPINLANNSAGITTFCGLAPAAALLTTGLAKNESALGVTGLWAPPGVEELSALGDIPACVPQAANICSPSLLPHKNSAA